MNVKCGDQMPAIRGEFSYTIYDKNRNVVEQYEDHNLIVNSSKVALAYLVSNSSAQSKVISKIGFGVSSTIPTPNDTALTGAYVKDVKAYSYPEPGRVSFTWELDYGEANGKNITEFGLICRDGSLFARKVRGALLKDSDLAVEGTWTIVF